MADEKTLYESENERSVDEVVDFLQQLAQWLSERRLSFEQDGQTTFLEIPERLMLEIEIEEEEGDDGLKRSLEIEIEWLTAWAEQQEAAMFAGGEEEEGPAMAAAAELSEPDMGAGDDEPYDPALDEVSAEEEALVRDFIEDLDDVDEEE